MAVALSVRSSPCLPLLTCTCRPKADYAITNAVGCKLFCFVLKYFRRTSSLPNFFDTKIFPTKILYNENLPIYHQLASAQALVGRWSNWTCYNYVQTTPSKLEKSNNPDFFLFFIYNNFACIEHGYTNSMMLIQVWTQCCKYRT